MRGNKMTKQESCATCGLPEFGTYVYNTCSCKKFIPLEQHIKKDCIPKSKYTPQKKEIYYSITPEGVRYVEEELLKLKKKKK